MVSHHLAKIGGHRLCGSEDTSLVAKEENSRHSGFNLPLLFISHRLTAGTGQIFEINFCQAIQKHWREAEKEKHKRKAIAKRFDLYATTIIIYYKWVLGHYIGHAYTL